MEFDAVLIAPRRAQSVAQGFWHNRTINDDLDACVANCPDKLALTAVQAESGTVTRFTYRELAAMADRVAVGLARLGVGRNDIVACQLPNWWQFTVTYLACSRIGAVMNPLMHIFRERELSFMLKHGEAKVLIVPKLFRGFDYEAMVTALQPSLPDLQHIVVVNGEGNNSFEALLSGPAWELSGEADAILSTDRPGPDDVTQLIYTSGTTGEPKGVMHTANTVMANIIPYAQRLHLGERDVVLMASPMAHQTGFMYGLMMPIMLKASAVLLDIWEPLKAIDLIRTESATFTMASTPFLTDLAKNVADSGKTVPTLATFLCAGAPIPGPLVEQARAVLGTKIVSAWGMTENGAVTLIKLDDDDERAFTTDGCPLPGVELKVIDVDGASLPPGQPGRLLLRACSNFGGYLKRPQWNATDAEGWFDTGDLASIDERGYVRITGRSKDVIIRGGENIPVVEIEALLYRHPAIAMAAIVAYPDERLGERACAVVVPQAGQSIDLPSIVEFMKSQKVAVQYIPERLIVRDAMPSTPSGKIQKFKLREMLRDGTA
ncbi:MAG: cyclohexanecarboxylate-CoA ligase [Comamonadaceae bacterium]|jgi:cyclohexanecarboxylate-CoA ligase|uniref:cyclohexanecarboxylate-CoA ligase n=1 Tax=Candidatus Skiveiella danica TaxID=3386177 RepID=UPI001B7BE8D8|nr:cyclohexanecarboxylate-CoA ligase [Comamonadaceae bacterium]MBK9200286.1 cyclohexanecarboxylate-CoA ligase [Betaproteobacteria bacterium]MBP6502416.1 cyclohexanecarboxylate-CoA ligase [Rhodoferax sp.]MBK6926472.1 cyclohexanecarboxylate-CoA ligase [Comamonadaceae bacterium]MBK7118389.1 cyclohexanecarboxylate-CoA ligase [Comamonadaceae bacterium]